MRNWRAIAMATSAACVLLVMSVFTAGPTFRADYRFSGSALTGFKPMGQADWKVQNGEIVGTPKDAAGGWLLVDGKEFQDTQIYASMKCAISEPVELNAPAGAVSTNSNCLTLPSDALR